MVFGPNSSGSAGLFGGPPSPGPATASSISFMVGAASDALSVSPPLGSVDLGVPVSPDLPWFTSRLPRFALRLVVYSRGAVCVQAARSGPRCRSYQRSPPGASSSPRRCLQWTATTSTPPVHSGYRQHTDLGLFRGPRPELSARHVRHVGQLGHAQEN